MVSHWEHIHYSHAEEKQTMLGQIRTLPKGRKRGGRVHEREKSKSAEREGTDEDRTAEFDDSWSWWRAAGNSWSKRKEEEEDNVLILLWFQGAWCNRKTATVQATLYLPRKSVETHNFSCLVAQWLTFLHKTKKHGCSHIFCPNPHLCSFILSFILIENPCLASNSCTVLTVSLNDIK